jgi:hypothetical protein
MDRHPGAAPMIRPPDDKSRRALASGSRLRAPRAKNGLAVPDARSARTALPENESFLNSHVLCIQAVAEIVLTDRAAAA